MHAALAGGFTLHPGIYPAFSRYLQIFNNSPVKNKVFSGPDPTDSKSFRQFSPGSFAWISRTSTPRFTIPSSTSKNDTISRPPESTCMSFISARTLAPAMRLIRFAHSANLIAFGDRRMSQSTTAPSPVAQESRHGFIDRAIGKIKIIYKNQLHVMLLR
jgi:hypothetical protein